MSFVNDGNCIHHPLLASSTLKIILATCPALCFSYRLAFLAKPTSIDFGVFDNWSVNRKRSEFKAVVKKRQVNPAS